MRAFRFSPILKKLLILLVVMVFGMTLGILSLLLVMAGEIYDYSDTANLVKLPPVDAIVCLAGGRGRITAAGDLWYQYWQKKGPKEERIPVLYISGMGHQANWNVFEKQLRPDVREVIQPEDTYLETESQNTEGNAQWLAQVAHDKGWHRILLFTSSYHMKRANLIFTDILRKADSSGGKHVVIDTFSLSQDPFVAREWRHDWQAIRVTLLEYVKWIYYKFIWEKDRV